MSAPIDTHSLTVSILPLARSLECNGIGAEGATALAAVLNETKITNLKCAATPELFTFVSAPIDTPSPILPLARSLRGNQIGAQGATALAAILNETKITNLKCAAAPKVFAFVSAPVDTPTLSLFLSYPSLAVSDATTSEPRAPLCWLPSCTRRRSPTSSAPPPLEAFAFVSAPLDTASPHPAV